MLSPCHPEIGTNATGTRLRQSLTIIYCLRVGVRTTPATAQEVQHPLIRSGPASNHLFCSNFVGSSQASYSTALHVGLLTGWDW